MTTELDNNTLEWAAQWIEGSLKGEPDQRVREFGKNMAMTLRAAKPAAPVVATDDVEGEAPEQIWISPDRKLKWTDYTFDGGIKYIRASSNEAKSSLGITSEVAAKLIHLRDTLGKMESSELVNEAWHTLYSVADPEIANFCPWAELERLAGLRTNVEGEK